MEPLKLQEVFVMMASMMNHWASQDANYLRFVILGKEV